MQDIFKFSRLEPARQVCREKKFSSALKPATFGNLFSQLKGLTLPVILLAIATLLIIIYALYNYVVNRYAAINEFRLQTIFQYVNSSLAEYTFYKMERFGEFGKNARNLLGQFEKTKNEVVIDYPFEDISFFFSGMPVTPKKIQAEIGFGNFEPLHKLEDLKDGIDTNESRGSLRLKITSTFEGKHYSAIYSQRALLYNLLLPVTSKFTFFVPEVAPDPHNDDNYSFNTVAFDFYGEILDRARPLVFNNHGEEKLLAPEREEYLKRGWIFLNGGPEKLVLNIGGGMHGNGEYFQFWDPRNTGTPLPLTYEETPTNLLLSRFKIKIMPFVFYDNLYTDIPDVFFKYARSRYPTLASCLQLFGNNDAPSRTRLFGNVARAFPVYCVLVSDLDGNGRINPASESVYMNAVPKNFYPDSRKLALIPPEFSLLQVDSFDDIFPDYATYSKYASKVIVEPYLYAYDYMEYNKYFPPYMDKNYKTVFSENDYNLPASTRLELFDAFKRPLFSGDLRTLNIETALLRKVSGSFESGIFISRYLKDRMLRLNDVVRVRGELLLPAGLEVEGGGIIIADGYISLRGITCPDDSPLTIVANREIEIDSSESYRNVFIVALSPSSNFRLKNNHVPLRLKGGLAVRYIEPDTFAGGGLITYATQYDPTSENYYACYRIKPLGTREKLK